MIDLSIHIMTVVYAKIKTNSTKRKIRVKLYCNAKLKTCISDAGKASSKFKYDYILSHLSPAYPDLHIHLLWSPCVTQNPLFSQLHSFSG